MIPEDVLSKYVRAGEIASRARALARSWATEGIPMAEFCGKLESFIREEGGEPAFPVNISVDDLAAHFTPLPDNSDVFSTSGAVKIDLGVHIDGYIADTAITVSTGDMGKSLKAACDEALDAAISVAVPGQVIGEIGELIERTIMEHEFLPVSNLGGHYLERYVLHAGTQIPNVARDDSTALSEGDVIAIEPFATTGSGRVSDGSPGNIYQYVGGMPRTRFDRSFVQEVWRRHRNLPFCIRWFSASPSRLSLSLSRLVRDGVVHGYGMLRERENSLVGQAEHTVIVGDKPIVITK